MAITLKVAPLLTGLTSSKLPNGLALCRLEGPADLPVVITRRRYLGGTRIAELGGDQILALGFARGRWLSFESPDEEPVVREPPEPDEDVVVPWTDDPGELRPLSDGLLLELAALAEGRLEVAQVIADIRDEDWLSSPLDDFLADELPNLWEGTSSRSLDPDLTDDPGEAAQEGGVSDDPGEMARSDDSENDWTDDPGEGDAGPAEDEQE